MISIYQLDTWLLLELEKTGETKEERLLIDSDRLWLSPYIWEVDLEIPI